MPLERNSGYGEPMTAEANDSAHDSARDGARDGAALPFSPVTLVLARDPTAAAELRDLAGELARHNILVNCVSPGLTMTPTVVKTRPNEWQDKVLSKNAIVQINSAAIAPS